jgi:hypothetical protein
MGGVDLADQQLTTYDPNIKSVTVEEASYKGHHQISQTFQSLQKVLFICFLNRKN